MQPNERVHMYDFLAENFLQIPGPQLLQKVLSGGLEESLHPLIKQSKEISEGIRNLQEFVRRSKDPEEEIVRQLGVDRVKLFRGISRRSGSLPPYESLYRGEGRHMGVSTQAVLQKYNEAGFDSNNFKTEFPDYIGSELGFMRHLCERSAEAQAKGDREAANRNLHMQKSFLSEHLLQWVPNFCMTMEKAAQTEFYKGLSKVLIGFMTIEADQIARVKLPKR